MCILQWWGCIPAWFSDTYNNVWEWPHLKLALLWDVWHIRCVHGTRTEIYLYDCIVTTALLLVIRQGKGVNCFQPMLSMSPKWCCGNSWHDRCRDFCSSFLLCPLFQTDFSEVCSISWAPVKGTPIHAEIFTYVRSVVPVSIDANRQQPK